MAECAEYNLKYFYQIIFGFSDFCFEETSDTSQGWGEGRRRGRNKNFVEKCYDESKCVVG